MFRRTIPLAALLIFPSLIHAQEKSVNPGINKTYEHPDVPESIQRFESNGRDVFDHRLEIVAALELKPGMTVADIGAGTGLFTRLISPAVGSTGTVYAVDIAKEFVDHIEKIAHGRKWRTSSELSASRIRPSFPQIQLIWCSSATCTITSSFPREHCIRFTGAQTRRPNRADRLFPNPRQEQRFCHGPRSCRSGSLHAGNR